jgi:diacylglycerol kinase (ATP)
MTNPKDKKTVPPERDQSVIGTMRIDPEPYKAASNRDDIDRTKFAVAGLLYMLRREHSIRNLSLMTLVALFLIVWLQVEVIHGVIVFVTVGLIWVTEALNSAVEAVVDLVTQDLHPMAKVAKDVAASATFVAVLMATITMAVLLGPPLLDQLLTLLDMIGLGL